MIPVLGVLAATIAMTTVAIAYEASPFNTDECPQQTANRWCASKATAAGWRLKYQTQSPAGMMDASWDIQVWMRGHEVMLSESYFGRAKLSSFCRPLQEVDQ